MRLAGIMMLLFCFLSPLAFSQTEESSFHELDQDVRIAEILQQLKGASNEIVVFRNVRIVDPHTATVIPDQTVIAMSYPVERIVWTGPAAEAPARPEATVIEGRGR